jgi:hypothetical protein
MLSLQLMWERTPVQEVDNAHAREQSALAGRKGPQELLIGKPVLGSTALGGRRGPHEQLISKAVLGSIPKSQAAKAYFGALVERRPLLEP